MDERLLVKRAKRGDTAAFAELYGTIYKRLYQFALYTLGNNNEETIVINDFTPEEKEMVMRMVHYIEEVHQLKCKKNSPPAK